MRERERDRDRDRERERETETDRNRERDGQRKIVFFLPWAIEAVSWRYPTIFFFLGQL